MSSRPTLSNTTGVKDIERQYAASLSLEFPLLLNFRRCGKTFSGITQFINLVEGITMMSSMYLNI